jgi:hypothetical protein
VCVSARVSEDGGVDDVRPCAVATKTGIVSPGTSTESVVMVDLGGRPAAESTHVFMFAMRAAVALSAFAFCLAAVTAATESGTFGFGGMNVAN